MPKITTTTVRFGGKPVNLEIFYNQDQKFYFKSYPEVWNEVGGFRNSEPTQEGLMVNVRHAISKTEETMKSLELVLMVKFSVGSDMWEQRTPMERGGTAITSNGDFPDKFIPDSLEKRVSFSGWGFLIDWDIAFIEKTGSTVVYRNANRDDATGEFVPGYKNEYLYPERRIIMPYTAEREAFFMTMAQATKSLALRLSDFLKQDTELLMLLIETGETPKLGSGQ